MKHIMLVFMSNLHTDRTTHQLTYTTYELDDGTNVACVQTNESAIYYMNHVLQKENQQLHDLFCVTTKMLNGTLLLDEQNDGKVQNVVQKEFISKRIVARFPHLQGHIHDINYDESEPVDQTIGHIASMAGIVRQYIDDHADEGVCIHADMTGGPRHAVMMLLAMMALLKFSGVTMGHVVYSDFQNTRVVDVTEIHRMFTLVSGVAEFVNYGSVQAIDEYFSSLGDMQKSPTLVRLLESMRSYADAVKICSVDRIEQELQQLNQRIADFQKAPHKDLQETVFTSIVYLIRQEYGSLITAKPDRLALIEWCVKKGFLQQALTMINEWGPEMIVDFHICYPVQEDIVSKMTTNKNYRSWKQNFIITYNATQIRAGNAPSVQNQIREIFSRMENDIAVTEQIKNLPCRTDKIEAAVAALNRVDDILGKLRRDYKGRYFSFFPFWKRYADDRETAAVLPLLKYAYYKLPPTVIWDFTYYLREKASRESLLKTLKIAPYEEYCTLFGIGEARKEQTGGTDKKDTWSARQRQWEEMLRRGIVQTNYTPEYMLAVLKGHDEIRRRRNALNHVNEDTVQDPEVLVQLITRQLTLLKQREQYKA